jgi:CheY-like chemotaxis protein
LSLPIHHPVDDPSSVCRNMTDKPKSPTAMVVETNYLIASVIEAPLLQSGFEVVIATSSEEALQVLTARQVHLALIDFRVEHSGADGLVARLQQLGVPYIFCTAASFEEVHEHFPNARVMPKPFSDEDLLAAVATMLPTAHTDPHA